MTDYDAWVAAKQGRVTGETRDPEIMRLEHNTLVEAGLLDQGQPTPWSHYRYLTALHADFTASERAFIRTALGMDTWQ